MIRQLQLHKQIDGKLQLQEQEGWRVPDGRQTRANHIVWVSKRDLKGVWAATGPGGCHWSRGLIWSEGDNRGMTGWDYIAQPPVKPYGPNTRLRSDWTV